MSAHSVIPHSAFRVPHFFFAFLFIPHSAFRIPHFFFAFLFIPHSAVRIPHFFRIPHSAFRIPHLHRVRALTLLELLIVILIISMVAVGTARVLGDGRVARARAGHRAELALAAQGELDRLRLADPSTLAEGRAAVTRPGLPPSTALTGTIRKRPDGWLELTVTAERPIPAGAIKVELVSIHPGGRQ